MFQIDVSNPNYNPNRVAPVLHSVASKPQGPKKSFMRRLGVPKQKEFVERKIGYGNLDEWNALSNADQVRIRGHSENLLKSFRYIKFSQQVIGRFPFRSRKMEDGSYTFTYSPCNLAYWLFFLTSIVVCAGFALFTLGGVYIFILFDPQDQLHDRCGNSWGTTILSRNMPAVVFVWSQLMFTATGSIYVILHGRSFLEYYNVVNEAVMQLDTDPTVGMLASSVRGLIVFGSLFIACIAVAISGGLHSLEEVSVFVVQCICFFFVKDIYSRGTNVFTASDYEALLANCNKCRPCYGPNLSGAQWKKCHKYKCFNAINTPSVDFKIAKWVGLAIIAYSLLGARALIRQFEFFCQVMVNLAKVWNKRFMNYASRESVNNDDPYRRRITHQLILKDHYEIVKLYNETEKNFSLVLFVYYASVFFNLICQFYYIALLSTQVTCATAVQRERQAALEGKCDKDSKDSTTNNTNDVLQYGLGDKYAVSFEDACSVPQKEIILHATITNAVLLVVTLSSFVITTLDADRVSHQADIGFYRVRRRGYMSCTTKKERNAMHSLVFSFTGPKPFCVTAAGYFPVRKKTIIVVISVAFVYFLIILGFKPGQNAADVRCYSTTNGTAKLVVRYPKII